MIQVCSIERPHPFPRGDTCIKKKRTYIDKIWKILNWPISPKLDKKHLWRREIKEGSCAFPRIGYNEIAKKNLKKKFKIFFSRWPLSQFQPNLAQSILGTHFFFQMEDNALFHGEMILRKWQKYIDECNNKILCVIER